MSFPKSYTWCYIKNNIITALHSHNIYKEVWIEQKLLEFFDTDTITDYGIMCFSLTFNKLQRPD